MNNEIVVLVAEDEESDFYLLQRALRNSQPNLHIEWVQDGVDAIRYLKGEGVFANRTRYPVPQMVLLDLKMPGATGMEVLEWIRDHPRYRVIPTLVMSSSEQPVDVQQAYKLGANTYFVKPGNFQTLTDLCKQIRGYWDYGAKPKIDAPSLPPLE